MEHTVTKTAKTADGSQVTITISSSDPIDQSEYMLLHGNALEEFGSVLESLGNAVAPSDKQEEEK